MLSDAIRSAVRQRARVGPDPVHEQLGDGADVAGREFAAARPLAELSGIAEARLQL
jgi:hypothetical protein